MHGDRFYCIENNLIFHPYWMIIILMFICICNTITERQVQAAVAEGATTLSDLHGQLGVAACCGCCAETAPAYLPGGARKRGGTGKRWSLSVEFGGSRLITKQI